MNNKLMLTLLAVGLFIPAFAAEEAAVPAKADARAVMAQQKGEFLKAQKEHRAKMKATEEKMEKLVKEYKKLKGKKQEAKKAEIREKAAEQVISKVADFEIPKGVLGMATQREFSRIADQLVRKQEDVEKFKAEKDKHLEDAKKAATARMKRFFILRKIANAENITVSDEEVDMQIRQMSAYLGYKEKEVRKMLDSNGGYSEIQSDILMSKVVGFIADQAKA